MNKRVLLFVAIVAVAASAVISNVAWQDLYALPWSSLQGLGVMLLLGLIAERLTVETAIGKSGSTQSVAYLPLLATVVLFGPAAGLIFIIVTHLTGDFIFRRKDAIKGIFNVSQHSLATGLGGLAYVALGGRAAASVGLGNVEGIDFSWIPLLAFGAIYLSINHALVAKVISLASGAPFFLIWRQVVGRGGGNFLYDLLVSPVAVAIALMGVELGVMGLVLAGLPLLAIRNAYLGTFKLQQANRDLLNALVKAIETRDPYTSGHSLRVANLARLTAETLGVSMKVVDEIEQSAILHDVGKIDAVYNKILKKPSDLTDEERATIQSHVTKGVELLETMSSVSSSVIENVRHHHERWDGRGYPAQLAGQDIPLGARVIGVCDAVDAMLSDRPYRKALDLPTVRRELTQFSGIQFDPQVVKVLVNSEVLEAHATSAASVRIREDSKASGIVSAAGKNADPQPAERSI